MNVSFKAGGRVETMARIALIVVICFGYKLAYRMVRGTAGRGKITSTSNDMLFRTLMMQGVGAVTVWYLIAPETLPLRISWALSDTAATTGYVILGAGIALRTWAHIQLGKQWSADQSLREDHQLITEGPYALTRHPIYYSYLIAGPGIVLITGTYLTAICVVGYIGASLLRRKAEEHMLATHFENQYTAYISDIRNRQATVVSIAVLMMSGVGGTIELFYIFSLN